MRIAAEAKVSSSARFSSHSRKGEAVGKEREARRRNRDRDGKRTAAVEVPVLDDGEREFRKLVGLAEADGVERRAEERFADSGFFHGARQWRESRESDVDERTWEKCCGPCWW